MRWETEKNEEDEVYGGSLLRGIRSVTGAGSKRGNACAAFDLRC
jgi:hypothetical protein